MSRGRQITRVIRLAERFSLHRRGFQNENSSIKRGGLPSQGTEKKRQVLGSRLGEVAGAAHVEGNWKRKGDRSITGRCREKRKEDAESAAELSQREMVKPSVL